MSEKMKSGREQQPGAGGHREGRRLMIAREAYEAVMRILEVSYGD